MNQSSTDTLRWYSYLSDLSERRWGTALKVFVSWSKNSRGVGKAVSDAVREIFDPVVDTFISQEILAGSRGLDTIDGELNDTDFGIICLTRANQTEQWINYEAGALSR
ncbi:hypothetical protein [Arthrobacter humicola]|uniref:hypothetical protein n=1 Tax=Arthrobacter humicola TaxID=409291 RepID=UPI001FAD399A|nr:hypothetical protein [Arthrobacter humicola]MCI9870573.1 hypothetical protein [Arthrobacter humicola]